MDERPIIFSAAMIRALRHGVKTQTRRLIKPSNLASAISHGSDSKCCPFRVGMRLWVKETWRANLEYDDRLPRDIPVSSPIYFDADDDLSAKAGKVRNALFMPRWMSRIDLAVNAVRAEQLVCISKVDAKAEGIGSDEAERHGGWRQAYQARWEIINGAVTWKEDMYVWVVEFKIV
jgi:hypothetical protein